MIALIFEVFPAVGRKPDYLEYAARSLALSCWSPRGAVGRPQRRFPRSIGTDWYAGDSLF